MKGPIEYLPSANSVRPAPMAIHVYAYGDHRPGVRLVPVRTRGELVES